MKLKFSSAFIAAALSTCLVAGNGPGPRNIDLVNCFDDLIQARFRDPMPQTLGMNRAVTANSFGQNYQPIFTDLRDFMPQNPAERSLLAELEQQHVQLGIYVFGLDVVRSEPSALNFRALKGPAVITAGTPRASWYPANVEPSGHLFAPPLVALQSESSNRTVAARPLIASEVRCVPCHNATTPGRAALQQPLGGILYAFRKAPK